VIATQYYDEVLLGQMDLLDDIRWLFVRGGIGQFIEMKDHTYHDLTLNFLVFYMSRSPVELNVQWVIYHFICKFNELNLCAFNEIFDFLPNLDVTMHKVPRQFNPNVF